MNDKRSAAHLDDTFGLNGKAIVHIPNNEIGLSRIQGLAVDSRGGILFVSSTADKFVLGCFADNGVPDERFANRGFVLDKFSNEGASSGGSITLLEDESILLQGSHQTDGRTMVALACFNRHGNYETDFGNHGKIVIPLPASAQTPPPAPASGNGHSSRAPIVLPDGKILAIHRNYLIQLLKSGQPNNDFNKGKPYIDIKHTDYPVNLYNIIRVSDDLICVAGNAKVANNWLGIVTMYTTAGELVHGFADNGYLLFEHLSFENNIVSIEKLNSKKLLITGQKIGFPNKGYITSITDSGKIVQDFNGGKPVLTPNDESRSLAWHTSAIDRQSRIIAVGGSMENGAAPAYLPIARFLQDGEPDLTFHRDNGLLTLNGLQLSEAIAIDKQERLLVGGITQVNLELKPVLIRILA
ncbi:MULTISPECIES: hypothetical protein [unclassified Pseudomonas]|uniref:hypothetical protein n=1 Tax=unclassified Pseudomonas TaxID=196821 RepID=UPI00200D17D6|nr:MULTISPECIES: hypothetical protein [unclassified Pseudomonas]